MDFISRWFQQHQRKRTRTSAQIPTGDTLEQLIHCEFHATNNEAEYEALIARPKNDSVLGESQATAVDLREVHQPTNTKVRECLSRCVGKPRVNSDKPGVNNDKRFKIDTCRTPSVTDNSRG
ncbi:hypothetical protein LWI29_028502 [Acer saccharum]|uniref:Uncharacterized protein n=1 Tax=Acer saccharum TaxID=4024 RepID=A0AA39VVW0_ACESA|nr:hypothetical protein LWI29_028502 [Acer saccharum]